MPSVIRSFNRNNGHRCGSRQSFGGAKDFWSNFPKLARKDFLCDFIANKFSPTKIMITIFGMTSKKGLHVCFCKHGAPFCPDFQGFCPDVQGFCADFRQIRILEGCLYPLHPRLLHTDNGNCFSGMCSQVFSIASS